MKGDMNMKKWEMPMLEELEVKMTSKKDNKGGKGNNPVEGSEVPAGGNK